jgi:hypothetical protein
MTPESDQPTGEHLAWSQWWASPWSYAHDDWRGDEYPAMDTLYRSGWLAPHSLLGVAACLPPMPNLTVLRLALATKEQLGLALVLIHNTFHPQAASTLSESHHLWCLRLSKTLPPAMLASDTDPLQLLHSWVDAATWQRLRLRFPRERVREVESKGSIPSVNSQLNTLWQAVVWRITTMANDNVPPDSNG